MGKKISIQKIIKNIQLISIYTLIIGLFTQGMYALPVPTTLFMSVPCGVLIIIAIFSKEKIFVINKYNILYYIFLIYMLMGEIFQSRENAIKYIVYFFAGIILMNTVKILTVKEKNNIINVYKFFCVLSAFITLISIIAKDLYFNNFLTLVYPNNYIVNIYNFYKTGAYSGPFIQTGTNAFFMGIGIIIVFSQIINNLINKKKVRISDFVILIILVAVLLLTKKRGMLLYTFFTIIFMFFYVFLKIGSKYASKVLKIIIPVVIVMIIIILSNESLLAVFNRFQKDEDYFSGRGKLYSYAIDMFGEKPIFGHGLKSFKENYAITNNLEEKMDAHNVFLQLLAEEGIIGTVIYLSQLFLILINTIRMLKNKIINNKNMMLSTISVAIQLIFILYFMSGNPLYDTFILFTYFMFVMIGFDKEEIYEKNRYINVS